jgi:uncharacterized membrane protein YhaH (DUF805 family)
MSDSTPTGFGHLLQLLFGLRLRVTRKTYVVAGFSLMLTKYALDSGVVFVTTGELYSPLRFLSPVMSLRLPESGRHLVSGSADIALIAMAVYALAFMWIGVSMTVRRASNAGKSPWLGVMFLVPVLNVFLILLMSLLPDVERSHWEPEGGFYRNQGPKSVVPNALRSAMKGVLAGQLIGACMTAFSVFGLGAYGAALFFLTPFVMGAVTAYLYNLHAPQGLGSTLGVSLIPVGMTAMGMMLLALEGAICIIMAAPIAVVIALLGALLGYAIPRHQHASAAHSVLIVLALPALASAEAKLDEPVIFETKSHIEIDAPPSAVWPNVIGFSELPPPNELEFEVGIAYPMRARIEGTGVGAVRHCEFSTGPFVEPITRWEPPTRLSFDVASQPPAMKHWSPVRHFHDYHIGESIQSKRGEFRLSPLPGGRTLLEGSTWYELRMSPPTYWSIWSDALIHSIHGRVLTHIKHLSEQRPRASDQLSGT